MGALLKASCSPKKVHGFDYGEHVKDALCVRASRLLDGPALSCVPENIPEVVGSTAKEHLASGREKKQAVESSCSFLMVGC